MDNPKFHICMPVYNASKFLKDAIESVLSQGYDNLELILVNDGSTDDSLVICNYYASQDERVVCISQSNRGQYEARRPAVKFILSKNNGACPDDWILCIDADGMYAPKYFECLATAINFDSNIDTVVYAFDRVSETGEKNFLPINFCMKV